MQIDSSAMWESKMEDLWNSKMKASWEQKKRVLVMAWEQEKRVLVMECLAREYWWSMQNLKSKAARTFFYSQATNEKSKTYWPTLNRRCATAVVSNWPHMIGDKK